MAIQPPPQTPCFETTKRLLAALINEGLISARISGSKQEPHRIIHLSQNEAGPDGESVPMAVQVTPGALIEDRNGEVLPVIQPNMLHPPVVVIREGIEDKMVDPGQVFDVISPWFKDTASQSAIDEVSRHLRSSGSNQGQI